MKQRMTIGSLHEARWKVLLVTAVAVFMALPRRDDRQRRVPGDRGVVPRTSLAGLSWVLNAYNIVFAALLVPAGPARGPAGAAADVLRRRLGCSSRRRRCAGWRRRSRCWSRARVVQAAGAALLVPTSLGLLLPEFPLERRATATALWGAIGGVAAATGPSLGGAARRRHELALGVLREPRPRAAGAGARRGGCCARRATRIAARSRTRSGIVLLVGGVGLLSLGIVKAPYWGWGSARVLGAFVGAALLLAAVRRALGAPPGTGARAHAVPRALVRRRERGVFVFALGFYAVLLANILFLTSVWDWSVLQAGVAVTPGPADGGAGGGARRGASSIATASASSRSPAGCCSPRAASSSPPARAPRPRTSPSSCRRRS